MRITSGICDWQDLLNPDKLGQAVQPGTNAN